MKKIKVDSFLAQSNIKVDSFFSAKLSYYQTKAKQWKLNQKEKEA
ncbi:unnamed protein product [Brassica napus]|uniref:(rape) hypothetical protein n=1 Tax=Brassica napus TaxID=3708 RepID=A0A816IQX5_BRANA|nr:unnamed protein product [Brassica napus]